jgi:hypothetical protein
MNEVAVDHVSSIRVHYVFLEGRDLSTEFGVHGVPVYVDKNISLPFRSLEDVDYHIQKRLNVIENNRLRGGSVCRVNVYIYCFNDKYFGVNFKIERLAENLELERYYKVAKSSFEGIKDEQ